MFLVYHMISKDHIIKGSCDLIVWWPYCVGGDVMFLVVKEEDLRCSSFPTHLFAIRGRRLLKLGFTFQKFSFICFNNEKWFLFRLKGSFRSHDT